MNLNKLGLIKKRFNEDSELRKAREESEQQDRVFYDQLSSLRPAVSYPEPVILSVDEDDPQEIVEINNMEQQQQENRAANNAVEEVSESDDSIRPGQSEQQNKSKKRPPLMLKYRMIRVVRELRETQVQIVCEAIDSASQEIVQSKIISNRTSNEERSKQLVSKVVSEKWLHDDSKLVTFIHINNYHFSAFYDKKFLWN